MKVTVAKSAGFCFGVRRAVEQVYHQVKEGKKPVYTYGPIIHNDQVVRDLEALGVRVIHAEEELESISEGTVIVRSHGVPRRIQEKIEARGLELVDATCPFVKKIHRIVMEESRKGAAVIIAGDESHPEVEGIRGWAEGPVWVVSRPGDMERLPLSAGKAAVLVAQTTFNYTKFEELVEIFSKKGYDGNVINTVCNATEERQSEARRIARTVDAMIVIGGRHSSNTQKLYEICSRECKNTYFVETLVDLDSKPFQSFRHVGITAGASTPNKIIEEVQKHVGIKF
ncbi:MAG TPA: 4-hydroxy-3-methylbut-2-enyl diphosphate reductase [Candidatus Scatomonas merdavium]|nr:4-hydroxy-3-methylbut-2-enyl diphosphate reductase [Candidatus Scatomonas merdavium]